MADFTSSIFLISPLINLVEFLLENTDWCIVILDDLSQGKKENLDELKSINDTQSERIRFIRGDIRKMDDVKSAISGCNYVVNLAAQTGVDASVKEPVDGANINIIGLINLLNVSIDHKISQNIERFVHISSGAPLGSQKPPLHEELVPKPLSPYGASKLAGEAYCRAYSASFGLRTFALRFSNIYGPKSLDKGSIVAKIIKNAISGKEIVVYGDGKQTRDYLYVKDAVNAIYLALTKSLNGNNDKFNLFNIATGVETSVNEIIELIEGELSKRGITLTKVVYKEKRAGDMTRNFSIIKKANKILGYKPGVSLNEGIRQTIDWFIDQNEKN
jgi:UDP-glucose 4-epimerase